MLSTRTGKPPIVWWCLCFFCYQSKLGCIVIDLCWKIFQFRYVTEKLSIEIFDNINGSWLPVLSTTLVSVNKQTHVHGLYRKANRLLSWDVSPSNDKAKSFWQQKVSHQISYAQKSIFFSVDLVILAENVLWMMSTKNWMKSAERSETWNELKALRDEIGNVMCVLNLSTAISRF